MMENNNIEQAFILFAIITLIFGAGVLFLIIYGILKNKKAFWITGTVITVICLCLYLLTFCGRYNEAVEETQEAREELNER